MGITCTAEEKKISINIHVFYILERQYFHEWPNLLQFHWSGWMGLQVETENAKSCLRKCWQTVRGNTVNDYKQPVKQSETSYFTKPGLGRKPQEPDIFLDHPVCQWQQQQKKAITGKPLTQIKSVDWLSIIFRKLTLKISWFDYMPWKA